MFYEWKLGTKTTDTHKKILDVYGEDVLVLRTVQNWFKKFKSGDFDLEDDFRPGQPLEVENDRTEVSK